MRFIEERIVKALMILSGLFILGLLLFILLTILSRGLPALSWDMLVRLPSGGFYLGKEGGIFNAILGSLFLILGAVLISFLLSVPVVMYINYYLPGRSRWAGMVRLIFDILFGIPSIVFGAFGFALMIYFGIKASLLGGIVTVAMLIAPILMRSLDEMARQVPWDPAEAALSLGATRYEMVLVMFRRLRPGVVTAVLLATGRGIGDAATVLFTAGYTDNLPTSLLQPAATLPLAIFFQLGNPLPEVQNRGYAAALILTLIILAISVSIRFLSQKLSDDELG